MPFRELVREVHAWINVTTGNVTLSQQAAALQRGLGGVARTIAMRAPPAVINFSVNIGCRHTDGATYIIPLKHEAREFRRGAPTQLWYCSN
eukprot:4004345-Pyramimonas_sp.AAC.1